MGGCSTGEDWQQRNFHHQNSFASVAPHSHDKFLAECSWRSAQSEQMWVVNCRDGMVVPMELSATLSQLSCSCSCLLSAIICLSCGHIVR